MLPHYEDPEGPCIQVCVKPWGPRPRARPQRCCSCVHSGMQCMGPLLFACTHMVCLQVLFVCLCHPLGLVCSFKLVCAQVPFVYPYHTLGADGVVCRLRCTESIHMAQTCQKRCRCTVCVFVAATPLGVVQCGYRCVAVEWIQLLLWPTRLYYAASGKGWHCSVEPQLQVSHG